MDTKNIVLYSLVAVTILTALAVLIAALGWVDNPDPMLVSWGIPGVLGEIVLTVILYFKGEVGTQVGVNLIFDAVDFEDLEFDSKNCHYKVCGPTGVEIGAGNIHPTLGQGGWAVSIPSSIKSDQSIALTLESDCGQKWKVRPFLPLVHSLAVAKIT